MEIYCNNRSEQELPSEKIEALALFVLTEEGVPQDTALSISFVGLEEMSQLNREYREKPEPTDVLSFNLDDPWEERKSDATEPLLMGDIVICPEVARQRAEAEELTFAEELWVLVVHGILHLLGYDHYDEEQLEFMETLEDDYFARFLSNEGSQ